MSAVVRSGDRPQAITLAMRALHRLDGTLPFPRVRMRNAAPILTVAFDDVTDTAATVGAPILEAAGARGTFYIATSLIGRDGANWRHADAAAVADLSRRGHEIGLHSHAHLPAAMLGRRAFDADLRRSRAALQRLMPGAPLDNYAYPFGFADPFHRACLQRVTRSCRTTHPGVNAGTVDPHRLLSHPLGHRLRADSHVDALLDEAVARRGWLIITLHDVSGRPSAYGCEPATLSRAVAGALRRGMRIATVAQALDACGMPAGGGP